jgi:uncharacterized protein (TIGR02996 family)
LNDRAALLSNVLNAPSDDTARLVLADWLEEHDEDAFGRFIRAGVLVTLLRSRATNWPGVLGEPLAHLVIGPSPLERMRVEPIVLRP